MSTGFRLALLAAVLCWLAPRTGRGDHIVLRNQDVIRDVEVVSFDEDGVKLKSGRVITLDQIEQAKLDNGQEKFNQLLQEVGGHLYRLRHLLRVGDYRELTTHAEAIHGRYASRTSDTAYLVFQSLMWGRLAEGKRELALEPYLRCFELLRKRDVDRLPLPGERTLKIDKATGLTPDLQPVWFDSRLAKDALEPVYQAITQMKTPRPTGVRIYFGSLALAAGDQDRAMQAIGESPYPTANLELHRQLVLAQRELAAERLAAAEALLQPLLNSAQRPQALYWLGVARTSSPSPAVRQAGLLDLLRLPASYGESQPDLSAAGLHRVMVTLNAMKDARGAVAVRRELLDGYGQTYHALKITKGKRPPPATDE